MRSFSGRRFGEGAGGGTVGHQVIQCVGCFGGWRFGGDVESEFDAPGTGAGSLVAEIPDPMRRVGRVLTGYARSTKKRNQSFHRLRLKLRRASRSVVCGQTGADALEKTRVDGCVGQGVAIGDGLTITKVGTRDAGGDGLGVDALGGCALAISVLVSLAIPILGVAEVCPDAVRPRRFDTIQRQLCQVSSSRIAKVPLSRVTTRRATISE